VRQRVIGQLRGVKWLNGAAVTEDEVSAALRVTAASKISRVSTFVIISKVKYTCSSIAHHCKVPLMCYRVCYVDADLYELVLQPGISEHCETTDTG